MHHGLRDIIGPDDPKPNPNVESLELTSDTSIEALRATSGQICGSKYFGFCPILERFGLPNDRLQDLLML
jgi:hypothetical protein